MEDYNTLTKTQAKLNITNDGGLYDTQDCMAKHN
jgi:hypothetical protein